MKVMADLGKVTAECMIKEFLHEKKVTRWYLSKLDGRLSFQECDDDQKAALVGKRATNDSAESSFSSFTQQLVTYNMIDLHAAGGTSDAKRNRYLFRPSTRKEIKDKVEDGMMFNIPSNLRQAIIKTAIEEAPRIQRENIEALEKQSQTRKDKEKEEYDKKMKAYASKQLQAKYYFLLYKGDSCSKSVEDLDRALATLSPRQKRIHIIDNIKIRVEGFGKKQYEHAWTRDGRDVPLDELLTHLKKIIDNEDPTKIPTAPPTNMPQRWKLPKLGQIVVKVEEIDLAAEDDNEELI